MSDRLSEVQAAAGALSPDEKLQLIDFLSGSLVEKDGLMPSGGHSVLDIPKVKLGKILRPLRSDDDVFGEMLENRV